MFELDATTTLRSLKLAIQQKLGIMTEQQRLIVVGILSQPYLKAYPIALDVWLSLYRQKWPIVSWDLPLMGMTAAMHYLPRK